MIRINRIYRLSKNLGIVTNMVKKIEKGKNRDISINLSFVFLFIK